MPKTNIETWFMANRRDLPWRRERSAYRVWLSEIMLQQTQVTTVIDYFNRFMIRFPSVFDLAAAPEDDVLALWSGLGYYSRARNLHKAAKIISRQWNGEFPPDRDALMTLPGVGSYTAGAILAFAFNLPAPVVDGNIARVLSRWFNDEAEWNSPSGKRHFEQISFDVAKEASSMSDWHEGLMELGATLCRTSNPACDLCPLASFCAAKRANTISQLPRRMAKRARTALKVACAIIVNGNYIWLEKNTQNKLFGGLYAPPNQRVDDENQLGDAISELLLSRGLENASIHHTPIVVKRTLTHRDLTLFAFVVTHVHNEDRGTWIHKNDLDSIGLSTAIRLLLSKYFAEIDDL